MVICCKRARAWADVPTEGEHTGPPTIDRELAVQVEQDGVASSPWWNSGDRVWLNWYMGIGAPVSGYVNY